jgi:hypothetical protein
MKVLLLLLAVQAASLVQASEVAYLTAQHVEGDKRYCYYHSSRGELLMVREIVHLCPITVSVDNLIR